MLLQNELFAVASRRIFQLRAVGQERKAALAAQKERQGERQQTAKGNQRAELQPGGGKAEFDIVHSGRQRQGNDSVGELDILRLGVIGGSQRNRRAVDI